MEQRAAKDRREVFCREYLVDFNGTRAAVAAGYSKRTARFKAHDLLQEPNIQQRITQLKDERVDRLQIKADDVLRELAHIGFSNVTNYQLDDSGVTLAEGASQDAMKAVAGIKRRSFIDRQGCHHVEVEFKLWDKVKALEDLGKHLGLFQEQVGPQEPVRVVIVDDETAPSRD